MSRWFPSGTAVLALVLGSGPARAATQRVVALPVQVDGELGADWTRQLDGGLADGLARGQFDVVSGPAACADRPCWIRAATEAEARYVVRTVITAEDRSYSVELELLDGHSGESLAQARDLCELCGVNEVRGIVADQAAALRTKLDGLFAAAPVVVVRSEPPEALVRIDGEAVGTTPLRREVQAGTHVARAEMEGYVVVEREFLAVAGVEEMLQLTLEPLPDFRPRFRPWGYVALGFAGASIATGVTFMVLDERPAPGDRCRGDNVNAQGTCRYRWDTLETGLIFTVAGGVLALAGSAVLVAMRPHRKASRARRAAWKPAASGVAVRF